MAGNPFDKYKVDEGSANPFDKYKVEDASSPAVRTTPISDYERTVVQNLFDTQPKRRAEYMKEVGLELDPKNDNQYRALGSNGPFDGKINPGFMEDVFGVQARLQGKGGLKAFAQHAKDNAWDMAMMGPMTAAGATAGAAGGLAAGAPAVPVTGGWSLPVMAGLGAALGGGSGYSGSEVLKKQLGDVYLDKDMPMDYRKMLGQALVMGMFEGGGQGLKQASLALKKGLIGASRESLKNVLARGGSLTQQAVEKIAATPEKFSGEAIDGANSRFRDLFKSTFGLDPESDPVATARYLDSPPADSSIGKALAPVRAARDSAIDDLAKNPAAQVSFQSAAADMMNEVKNLEGVFNKTPEQKEALVTLREQLSNMTDMAKAKAQTLGDSAPKELGQVMFNMRDLNSFKQGLQGNAFKETAVGTMSENPIVSGVAGRFRKQLDAVAQNAGSQLPDLNAQLSKGLDAWQTGAKILKPDTMIRAAANGASDRSSDVRLALQKMDQVTGQDLSQQFETGALQSKMENFFQKPPSATSGQVMEGAIKGMTQGAGVGAGVGHFIPGVGAAGGAVAGGVVGGIRGAMNAQLETNPAALVSKIANLGARYDATAAASQLASPEAQYLMNIAGKQVAAPQQTGQQQSFQDFLAQRQAQQDEVNRRLQVQQQLDNEKGQ